MRTDLSAQFTTTGTPLVQLINPPPQSIFHSSRRLPVAGLLLLPCLVARAEITLDGSLGGPSGPLAGPDVEIPATVGLQEGANLFHSFGVFEVLAGESATFTDLGATGPIARILSRVTGGSMSTIEGLLASTIPGADLYLLNPAGVVFGAGAELNVQGSFHVSTADYLTLGEEGCFAVSTDPQQSLLTSAPPVAFGFLGEVPQGAITVEGATLEVSDGEALSVVGGDIEIRGGELVAPAGRHNITSVASAGEVVLGETDVAVEDIDQLGRIDITESTLTANGESGGEVFIRGGELRMENARVEVNMTGAGTPGAIDIKLSENLSVSNSLLISETSSSEDSGDIAISASDITLNHSSIGSISSSTGNAGHVTVETSALEMTGGLLGSVSANSGRAGDISLQIDTLTLRDGAQITTGTGGTGDGGNLTVTADESILIEEQSRFIVVSRGNGDAGSLSVSTPDLKMNEGFIEGTTWSEGQGGDMGVEVGTLTLQEGAQIVSASTSSKANAGSGGNLVVTATKAIEISGQDENNRRSGLLARTFGSGNSGNLLIKTPSLTMNDGGISSDTFGSGYGGNVQIEIDSLTLNDGAQISSTSRGVNPIIDAGPGGNLTIIASDSIRISGQDENDLRSGLFIQTFGTGDGGNGFVQTPLLWMNDTLITTTPEGIGRGGDLRVETENLVLEGGAQIGSGSGGINPITRDVITVGGQGGDIIVNGINSIIITGRNGSGFRSGIFASTFTSSDGGNIVIQTPSLIMNDSQISAETFGVGRGGDISIETERVNLSGGAKISTESLGTIAEAGDAGNITLQGSEMLLDQQASISTSAKNAGGGNITITADTLQLTRESPVRASVAGGEGGGGNVTLNAETIVALENSDITANVDQGLGGDITINAEVFLRSPDVDLNVSSQQIGNDGDVQINTPDLDIAGSITNLPTTFLNAASRLSDRCAARTADTVSSFVQAGAGGIPPGPEGAALSGYMSTFTHPPQGNTPSLAEDTTSFTARLPALALFECGR